MPGMLTQFDRDICASNRIRVSMWVPTAGDKSEKRNILFQFPPMVVSDGRSGDWKEEAAGPNSGDKIGIYQAAGPRQITVEWKYVVGFAGWTIDKIKTELKSLRGYFRNPFLRETGGQATSPMIIELLLWDIGGNKPMTFRIHAANIKHGKTLVGSNPNNVFPLYTEVSVEFKSWPKIGQTKPAQTVPGQLEFTPDWF